MYPGLGIVRLLDRLGASNWPSKIIFAPNPNVKPVGDDFYLITKIVTTSILSIRLLLMPILYAQSNF